MAAAGRSGPRGRCSGGAVAVGFHGVRLLFPGDDADGKRFAAAGRAGANRMRVSTRGLRPGTHRLTVKAAGARATVRLRIMR